MKKIERALLSVYDKTGLGEFARALAERGIELLSTGGTARALREAGLAVTDISAYTGFPEMLEGRVKTLHPKVHGGLLFKRGDAAHEAACREQGIQPIDLVCVNLYPFEETVARPGASFDEAIEQIDIGGPAMIRSAAKNMRDVTVVIDPADYAAVLGDLEAHEGATTEILRRRLACKVFARVAAYNAGIAAWLGEPLPADGAPPSLEISVGGGRALRYGENPHQAAYFYREPAVSEACIAHAEVLQGKEMSYNNFVDGDAALEAVREFAGQPAVAVIKHTNPCGCATGRTLAEAFEAAWAGDPVSAFGSVIAVTQPVDLAAAQCLKGRFIEVLIAPDFEEDALGWLQAKSANLRLLKLDRALRPAQAGQAIKQINGGWLAQDRDTGSVDQWSCPTASHFPEAKRALAEFGVKVCKHVKSNAIVLVREYREGCYALLGMGAGQPNRVDSVRKLAVARARENIGLLAEEQGKDSGPPPQTLEAEIMGEAVLVSDAFFPFPDNIHHAAEAGVRYVVQPGGSKRDEEVIAVCDQYGIAMAFTGMRHFKH